MAWVMSHTLMTPSASPHTISVANGARQTHAAVTGTGAGGGPDCRALVYASLTRRRMHLPLGVESGRIGQMHMLPAASAERRRGYGSRKATAVISAEWPWCTATVVHRRRSCEKGNGQCNDKRNNIIGGETMPSTSLSSSS